MRKHIVLASCLVMSLCLSACTPEQESDRIRFGVILSLTGPAAPYGLDNLAGLEVARDYLNDSGGINGRKIELSVEDSAGDSAQALTLARRFASDPAISAILGPTRTGSTVAVSRILPTLKIPIMSVGSTGDWASAVGDFNDWTFRSTRVDTYLIHPLLQAARDHFGVQSLAIISTTDDDWSMSVLKVYERAANDVGIDIVASESQMTGDTDRSAQLTKIAAAQPDLLAINTLSTDAPTIADQARRQGITAHFLGTAGFTNPDTWSLAATGVLDGTLVAENFYPNSPRSIVVEFVERYRKKYSREPPSYAAYAFDGLLLVAEATRKVDDSSDRDQIRSALGKLENFEGVLGRLTYKGKGDAQKEAVILEIREDGYRILAE